MTTRRGNQNVNGTSRAAIIDPNRIVASFQEAVIDRFQISIGNRIESYQSYLNLPVSERQNDEADAVDQRFALDTLHWLGFDQADWNYNRPQSGHKANRPDYVINRSVGKAFIWEDKNSTIDFAPEHVKQMRRYAMQTAGYAVWCNMRRIVAVRFLSSDTLKYEELANISFENLFGSQAALPFIRETEATNLALFKLLFSKERFTQFAQLAASVSVDEATFKNRAILLNNNQAIQSFIAGSRQSLDHLRLAALSQIRKVLAYRDQANINEQQLKQEWDKAQLEFINNLLYAPLREPVRAVIEGLTPRLGTIKDEEIEAVTLVIEKQFQTNRLSATITSHVEKWANHAKQINNASFALRFQNAEPYRIVDAYTLWSKRQTEQEDVKPEIFAEQVAYVFFVRLLLIRILEDKAILQPRLASDGGFRDWSEYVGRHFKELDGIGILNQNYCGLLAQKAGLYYLHFFQRDVFDWFLPDDYMLVETLEFLCRYNFQEVASDIIGFTYEEYIDRVARNRKGHFLTRGEVVEYMLDLLEYEGAQVLERRILDPACGSGSFLVHAARRYRQALVSALCDKYNLPDEETLNVHPVARQELARRYLSDLATIFFGMEINPFACYLAEMNLLIQGLDDMHFLQIAGDFQPIERFQIFNTDSLDLPNEVLHHSDVTGISDPLLIEDRFSDRIVDEAYPLKARLDDHTQGFFYIICNPPYVNSRWEALDANRFRSVEFYRAILSGDTNLYLLFLRLGLYYLSDYGQMIYIVPLTIFGDKSAGAARKLFTTPPFNPTIAVRFYRGDVLFPGVDQAVGIIRIGRLLPSSSMLVGGGENVDEARSSQFVIERTEVIDVAPYNTIWQGNWLVANDRSSLAIWQKVRQVSDNLSSHLGIILNATFDVKQGDINATAINPLRLGVHHRSSSHEVIAIYKGEDVNLYSLLPSEPSDWARVLHSSDRSNLTREAIRASQILEQLQQLEDKESGIALRHVARLNTRERLIGTWFERDSRSPFAFTNALWRMTLKQDVTEEYGKAILGLLTSKSIVYLVNLFSTNNNVSKDELDRIPIPDPQSFPSTKLSSLVDNLLNERANLEQNFVARYRTMLPQIETERVSVSPSAVLSQGSLPKISIAGLIMRGVLKNLGDVTSKVMTLRRRGLIEYLGKDAAVNQMLDLFLEELAANDQSWTQAESSQVPELLAVPSWLTTYSNILKQAQESWDASLFLQQQIDETVIDWYGFDPYMHNIIAEGLPWARRRKNASILQASLVSSEEDILSRVTSRLPVNSSSINSIGYEIAAQLLEIEFHTGEIFQYQFVPPEVYERLKEATSKGTFYILEIKGKYNGQKI